MQETGPCHISGFGPCSPCSEVQTVPWRLRPSAGYGHYSCLESRQRATESFLQTQLPSIGEAISPAVQRTPWSWAPPRHRSHTLPVSATGFYSITPSNGEHAQTKAHLALVMVWGSVQMGSWLRATSWWGYAGWVLRPTRIQGVLGATGSPPDFAGSETKAYLEQRL